MGNLCPPPLSFPPINPSPSLTGQFFSKRKKVRFNAATKALVPPKRKINENYSIKFFSSKNAWAEYTDAD